MTYRIKQDGERYVPWSTDHLTAYEHIHRYMLAATYAVNKRVLDVASGEGYGTALLASVAQYVVGLDYALETLRHARDYHQPRNIYYAQADAQVFALQPNSIDVAVSFETIEHLTEHSAFLSAIKRALAPTGTLLISTPDRLTYQAPGSSNPYHQRELSRAEFLQLLKRYFRHVALLGQNLVTSSVIARVTDEAFIDGQDATLTFTSVDPARLDYPVLRESQIPPRYYVAVCSDAEVAVPACDFLLDNRAVLYNSLVPRIQNLEALVQQKSDEAERANQQLQQREVRVNDLSGSIATISELLNRAEQRSSELSQQKDLLTGQIADHQKTVDGLRAAVQAREHIINRINVQLADERQIIHDLNKQLAARAALLADLQTQLDAQQTLGAQLSGQLTEHEQIVARLTEQANTRDQNIAALNAEIAAYRHEIATLAEQRAAQQATIASLNDQVAAEQQQVMALNAQVEAHERTIADLIAQISAHEERIVRLDSRIAEQDAVIADLREQLAGRDQTIADLNGQVSTLQAERISLHTQVLVREYLINDLHARVANREAAIADFTTQLDRRFQHIADLSQQVAERDRSLAALNQQIAEQAQVVTDLNIQVTAREQTLIDLHARIAAQEAAIVGLNAQIQTQTQEAADLNRQIGRLTDDNAALNAQAAQLAQEHAQLAAQLAQHTQELDRRGSYLEAREALVNMLNAQLLDRERTIETLAADRLILRQQNETAHQTLLAIRQQVTDVTNSNGWRLEQRWYRLRQRFDRQRFGPERVYVLVRSAGMTLRAEGPGGLLTRIYLFLFKGERRYTYIFRTAAKAPVPLTAAIEAALAAFSPPADARPAQSPIAHPRPAPVAAPQVASLPIPGKPVEPVKAVQPPPPADQIILPEEFKQAFDALLQRITRTGQPYVSILNWHTGLALEAAYPTHAVFTPPSRKVDPVYLDRTIDVVVVRGDDPPVTRKARQFARYAVVRAAPDGQFDIESLEPADAPARQLPGVSLVLPVYNQFEMTTACLEQMLATLPADVDWEIIVVDDCSPEANFYSRLKQWEERSSRIRIVQNPQNVGFVRSCNNGAQLARKDIIVTLNNDILPQPGWIEALLQTFVAFPDAGVVGGKLVFPDGTLQEAGGVVFRDGNAWNIGRSQDPRDPMYNFVRPVDYVSGAFLATRRSHWQELGGYDEQFVPGYYEDTDFCFATQARGLKVYYQPRSAIIHLEGASHGTDPATTLKRHQVVNAGKFAEKWQAVLPDRNLAPDNARPENIWPLVLHAPTSAPKRVLFIAPLLPEFDRESGSRRLAHFIDLFQEAGWFVTILAQNPGQGERYIHLLQQRGVAVFGGAPYFNEPEPLLRAGQFDLVLTVFWEMGEHFLDRVRAVLPQAKYVIDSVDLHFLRNARGLLGTNGRHGLDSDYAAQFQRELNAYARADAVLMVSQKEASIVNDFMMKSDHAWCIPDMENLAPSPVLAAERRGILYIGNFRHPPNVQAYHFLIREIVPHLDPAVLKAHPLYIVGNDMQRFIGSDVDQTTPHVHRIGWVPSILPYLEQARINVVPLRVGAGTKRKVLQALMVGTPTVSTAIGVEGMGVRPGTDVLVEDDPKRFADAITLLLQDETRWRSLLNNGRQRVCNLYTHDAVRQQLARVLDHLFSRNGTPQPLTALQKSNGSH